MDDRLDDVTSYSLVRDSRNIPILGIKLGEGRKRTGAVWSDYADHWKWIAACKGRQDQEFSDIRSWSKDDFKKLKNHGVRSKDHFVKEK